MLPVPASKMFKICSMRSSAVIPGQLASVVRLVCGMLGADVSGFALDAVGRGVGGSVGKPVVATGAKVTDLGATEGVVVSDAVTVSTGVATEGVVVFGSVGPLALGEIVGPLVEMLILIAILDTKDSNTSMMASYSSFSCSNS